MNTIKKLLGLLAFLLAIIFSLSLIASVFIGLYHISQTAFWVFIALLIAILGIVAIKDL